MSNKITQLYEVTPQQLGDLISKSVKFQLEELKENLKQKESEEYLTRNEVATMLKIDLSTVHNWTRSGKLKSLGLGGRVYFKRSEIEEALIKIN